MSVGVAVDVDVTAVWRGLFLGCAGYDARGRKARLRGVDMVCCVGAFARIRRSRKRSGLQRVISPVSQYDIQFVITRYF